MDHGQQGHILLAFLIFGPASKSGAESVLQQIGEFAVPEANQGKVALASAPSASSATPTGHLQGWAREGRHLSSQPGYVGPSGLSIRVSTGCTIADAADGADGVFGK